MIRRTLTAMLLLCVAAANAAASPDWISSRRSRGDGVHIRVGRNYHLPPDQRASWPVIVIGGRALIEGRADDDIVVIGGPVEIGGSAVVHGNVVSIGGDVRVADTAEVTGEIHDVSVLWPEIGFALRDLTWEIDRGWWAVFALIGTVFRFTLTLMAVCLMTLVAPGWIRRIQPSVGNAPVASALVGAAAQILLVPATLVVVAGLVLTIIGIPLLILVPFALLALLIAWLAGYAAVAVRLGGRLADRPPIAGSRPTVFDAARGVTLLFVVTFIGHALALLPWVMAPVAGAFVLAGLIVECIAWTVGLGASLLAPLHRTWEVGPPPLPSTSAPPPSFGTANA